MHGRGGEEGKRRRHMWPVHAPGTAATTAPAAPPCPVPTPDSVVVDSERNSLDFFLKDGRKFHVGDCALFQSENSPPFIGIIRWFTPGKEAYLKLGVNWLYRPSDVKLAKGILLEAAPNEVFYSFHKDETSTKFLLHPCKVAFLRKGVELPSGISSFVCWRVYDITSKCLWWLTDTDYINERQEEVDQLLDKTRLEMHAAVQSGGRSPKPLSGHLSAQQLKSSSDSVQNSSTSSQAKGKKRGDRGDQGSESMKRERSSKADDGDSGIFRVDSMIKAEIAKITDKGGLTNNDAVEKLVQLMQIDRGEKKIDLAGRVLLADVIAATDRNDCLIRFVQLRGVPMLDDWLQEAHKGRNGDGNSPMEGDKSVEDLLLALLRALDKLPVNLSALQTCHIGRSVNNLRSHKNVEIQKKARSLVDTWKKRVDAEMTKIEMAKLNDAKSIGSSQAVSWPGKQGFSEVSVGGNKRAASTEVAVKSASNQPSASKSLPVKNGHGDSIPRLNSATSGSVKLPSISSASVATGTKDSQTRMMGATSGTAELLVPTIKDEKSSSSSQSQNNSQSCSNDHAKTAGSSWKEDVRSSTAGSTNTSKTSGSSSRHRRLSNGFVGTGASGVQKDNGFGKSSSLTRNTTPEKVVQSGLTVDRTADVPVGDQGNSHRLIVRLPNPGRSPARTVSGGSLEDLCVTGSRGSSPGILEKNEHVDHKAKLKSDVCPVNSAEDVNTESCQSNDVKVVVGSGHANRSPKALHGEHNKSTDETGNAVDSSKAGNSLEPKSGKPFESSSSPINVLVESCVKYDKNALTGSCLQLEEGPDPFPSNSIDRLFTKLDADKMSKSELSPPIDSPGRKSPDTGNPCKVNEIKSNFSSDDIMSQIPGQPKYNNAKTDSEKHESSPAALQVQDDIKQNGPDSRIMPLSDGTCVVRAEETKSKGEHRDQYPTSAAASCKNSAASSVRSENKLDNVVTDGHVPLLNLPMDCKDGISEDNSANYLQEMQNANVLVSDSLTDREKMAASPSSAENKSVDCVHDKDPECNVPLADGSEIDHINAGGRKCEKESLEGSLCPPLDKQRVVDESLHVAMATEHIPPVMATCSEDVTRNVHNATDASASAHPCLEVIDELQKEKFDSLPMKCQLKPSGDEKDHTSLTNPPLDKVCSSVISSNGIKEDSEKVMELQSIESAGREEPPLVPAGDTEQSTKTLGTKLCGDKAGEAAEVACSPEASAVIFRHPDPSAKLGFDLNEGFSVDDGNIAEPVTPSVPGCSSTVYLPSLTPFTVSPMANSLPLHITIASPAKGPFVPPETLLKNKGEGGWKGSAATSAFRPAEPRKVLEMPLGTADAPSSDVTSGKQSSDVTSGKQCHPPLNFDLNVADETVLEDTASRRSAQQEDKKSGVLSRHDAPLRSSGGLDFDLNRVVESAENGQLLASTSRRLDAPLLSVRPASRGFPDGEGNALRDFDLNNGPGTDEVGAEQLSRGRHTKSSSVPFLTSLRMNGNEPGILSSWYPAGNAYSAVALPSFLPDRGDQAYPVVAAPGAQMILGSAAGSGAFGTDLYRGPVLSSSPTVTFPPAAAFPYAGFPFGSSFPLASTSFSGGPTTYIDPASGGPFFPAIPTPLMGRVGAAPSPYMRPNIISLPEGSTCSESNKKWGGQSLDLNAGPGSVDIEGRENRSSLTSRQLSVASSQAFSGEQARIYQTAGGLKRKEPEGGWDSERFPYKQHPWQ